MRRNLSKNLTVLAFIFPALFLFTVVVIYPIFQTLLRSFYRWDGIGSGSYIGFNNYLKLLADPDFGIAVRNGLIFAAVLVVYEIGVGALLALTMLDKSMRLKRAFKTTYFLPVVLSITVVCQLWVFIYNMDYGLINKLFEALGFTYRQSWLYDKNTAIIAVAFTNAWQYMGILMTLIYAAAISIPEQYYEAARIDGASVVRTHLSVTLPFLTETFRFCLIISLTGGLRAFSNMFIMTGGGPGNYTFTLTYLMYKSAFTTSEFGYACSSSVILVAQCLLFTLLINRLWRSSDITF